MVPITQMSKIFNCTHEVISFAKKDIKSARKAVASSLQLFNVHWSTKTISRIRYCIAEIRKLHSLQCWFFINSRLIRACRWCRHAHNCTCIYKYGIYLWNHSVCTHSLCKAQVNFEVLRYFPIFFQAKHLVIILYLKKKKCGESIAAIRFWLPKQG